MGNYHHVIAKNHPKQNDRSMDKKTKQNSRLMPRVCFGYSPCSCWYLIWKLTVNIIRLITKVDRCTHRSAGEGTEQFSAWPMIGVTYIGFCAGHIFTCVVNLLFRSHQLQIITDTQLLFVPFTIRIYQFTLRWCLSYHFCWKFWTSRTPKHILAMCRKGPKISVCTWKSCFHHLWSEQEQIILMTTAKSFDLGIPENCTLLNWGQKPDVTITVLLFVV